MDGVGVQDVHLIPKKGKAVFFFGASQLPVLAGWVVTCLKEVPGRNAVYTEVKTVETEHTGETTARIWVEGTNDDALFSAVDGSWIVYTEGKFLVFGGDEFHELYAFDDDGTLFEGQKS